MRLKSDMTKPEEIDDPIEYGNHLIQKVRYDIETNQGTIPKFVYSIRKISTNGQYFNELAVRGSVEDAMREIDRIQSQPVK